MRHAGRILPLLALTALSLLAAAPARAQTATIRGYVTDRSDGSPLTGATIALYAFTGGQAGATPLYGAAADQDGLFIITTIQPAAYLLRVSFVGYVEHTDTLALAAGQVQTVNVALVPEVEGLDEVVVETERTTGAARVTAGQQTIRPEEIELVPSPDISADLANYLATLPGIVSTGDRGGQFFIRGGEPSQNLVLLDGMIVYQPFHVLGFYSAFPADIINQVDLYAGGFGARYAGRLSSVIDVAARLGNNRRFAGMASVSPFSGALRLEGPIVPGRFSFIASARESFVEQVAEPLIREEMPFRFGDAFAKIQGALTETARMSVIGLSTHDRGVLRNEIGGARPEELGWTNSGIGARLLIVPRILPVSAVLNLSHSRHRMEMGPQGDPLRSTSIRSTRAALDATFVGDRIDTDAGWEFIASKSDNDLGGLFQNTFTGHSGRSYLGLYVEPEFPIGGLRLRPGARIQFYNNRFEPYLEPRLRAVWERDIHTISGAVGLYHQGIVGLSDRRDAASIFTAWTDTPRPARGFWTHLTPDQDQDVRAGRIGTAYHAILGYRSNPANWIEYSVEGFYKKLSSLFVAQLTALPRLTTLLQPASGRSLGFEARVEFRFDPVYAYVNYGLSSTSYSANDDAIEKSYGLDELRYRPSHDRRHQVNALASSSFKGFDFSVRWEFGSGFPYTRPVAFDGVVLLTHVESVFDLGSSRRVIYERPFGSELPAYHRLDVSVDRTWRLPGMAFTVQASAINAYDRRNLFYVDTFTTDRVDQLPFVPSLGIRVSVE